jgi:hypothetical protein
MSLNANDDNSPPSASMESRQTACADCAQQPPATETNYTLISARHGWRLSRGVDENGQKVMRWRCPDCWKKYRTSK